MKFSWILGLLLFAAVGITGCGPGGGTAGDVNDPTVDGSDEEQLELMQNEGDIT